MKIIIHINFLLLLISAKSTTFALSSIDQLTFSLPNLSGKPVTCIEGENGFCQEGLYEESLINSFKNRCFKNKGEFLEGKNCPIANALGKCTLYENHKFINSISVYQNSSLGIPELSHQCLQLTNKLNSIKEKNKKLPQIKYTSKLHSLSSCDYIEKSLCVNFPQLMTEDLKLGCENDGGIFQENIPCALDGMTHSCLVQAKILKTHSDLGTSTLTTNKTIHIFELIDRTNQFEGAAICLSEEEENKISIDLKKHLCENLNDLKDPKTKKEKKCNVTIFSKIKKAKKHPESEIAGNEKN